jgi:hypothetical protein
MNSVEGPFAFAFWEAKADRLWFGRDRLGRRRSTHVSCTLAQNLLQPVIPQRQY